MANFELDRERYVPPGHHIIDCGPNRLPRSFTTPAIPIARRHEQFVIAEVMPASPANLIDFRNSDDLRAALNTFGEFHHWVSDDPYLVRSIVFASFSDDFLVPRSVTFSEYAAWGGARVSWSAPLYIMGAAFAEEMPNDEDHVPLNGNPHPIPGQLEQDNVHFALPPYPALWWNHVPPPPPMSEPPVQPEEGGWGWHAEAPDAEPAAPEQDQESIVIDQPTSSDSVQLIVIVDPQPDNDEASHHAPYQR
ncbi:hypothetical protein D1007_53040 [Hordeum vulgare]|nr:hypothetical protein D1007_53040 [Hordeum vulgare]